LTWFSAESAAGSMPSSCFSTCVPDLQPRLLRRRADVGQLRVACAAVVAVLVGSRRLLLRQAHSFS
jgi:hypothetical protein